MDFAYSKNGQMKDGEKNSRMETDFIKNNWWTKVKIGG